MRKTASLITAVLIFTHPAAAQEEDAPSLMERGAQQFLEGLLNEMEPAWRELQGFMDAMGPAMIELMDEVKDWSAYEPPEILDNGDIIIRRKPEPVEPPEVPETTPDADMAEPIEI